MLEIFSVIYKNMLEVSNIFIYVSLICLNVEIICIMRQCTFFSHSFAVLLVECSYFSELHTPLHTQFKRYLNDLWSAVYFF